MSDSSTIIDLTDSFTLADHCALSDVVIDLATDDSFDLSTCNKVNLPTVEKQDSSLGSKNLKNLKQNSGSKFGDCPICWEEIGSNPLASTKCGHVYCLKCLQNVLKVEKRCPTCRQVLSGKSAYHPLYLSKS